MSRLSAVVGAIVGLLVLMLPSVAFADPAGPTDYLSEVTEVVPSSPAITAEVLGGDSFVELTVEPGTDVVVIGYQGEDYLWFRPDGTVLENQNSPSTYTNDERFGGGEIPPNATRDAEPDWEEVGSGGRYSWHDHRAHWMQTIRPPGRDVGDQIVEGVIPLVVDGQEVDVTVISTWLAEPSPVPALLGAVGAGGLVLAALWRWRSGSTWSLIALPLAAAATVAGVAQFTSLPTETGPRIVWVALPVIALVAAGASFVGERRSSVLLAQGAALVAAVQLAIWGFVKREGLTAAIVPTSAPGWFDRFATAAALVGGVGLAAVALWALFGPRPPRAATQTA